ncbi:MAG: hypothetical protein HVN35_09020 [Methanobacteriaceae archaeon]|nr:hypothetical protein [Methanobacteriaceae archaeon]
MDNQKIILYTGSIILLLIGIYSLYMGQTSQAVTWITLGVIFLSVSPQLGKPIKAVKIRKTIILVCAVILLGIGGYMLYEGDFLAGIAWIVAGCLGMLISSMMGHQGVLDPHQP